VKNHSRIKTKITTEKKLKEKTTKISDGDASARRAKLGKGRGSEKARHLKSREEKKSLLLRGFDDHLNLCFMTKALK